MGATSPCTARAPIAIQVGIRTYTGAQTLTLRPRNQIRPKATQRTGPWWGSRAPDAQRTLGILGILRPVPVRRDGPSRVCPI